LRVVDAIVSGVHERGSSHYELLRALQSDDVLDAMNAEADARGYRTHEFGDFVFIEQAVQAKAAARQVGREPGLAIAAASG